MLRIAFVRIGGHAWTGGWTHLLNLLRTLSHFSRGQVCPVVFTGDDCPVEELNELSSIAGLEVIRTRRFKSGSHFWERMLSLVYGSDPQSAKLFEKHKINLVFEAGHFFGWRFPIPTLAWIPDFLHRGIPQMLPWRYRIKREISLALKVISGRTIMLSSEHALRMCQKAYPKKREHMHVVKFAVFPQKPPSLAASRKIAETYGLPRNFFYLPNQFWKHKNHITILDALRICRDRGRHIVVACSGQSVDPISPGHFQLLCKLIAFYELKACFRYLGMIPYQHTRALLRACDAMINPSLWEGWSSTVEEAKMQGTPMMLSDLEVHREQVGSNAVFFHRFSAKDLSEKLMRISAKRYKKRKTDLKKAETQSYKKAKRYAAEFIRLAEKTTKKK